jgi:glycosyltransferase involved in cell wall biosynthesis
MASSRLKIIHLIAPGSYGGAESVVRMLVDGLARRGHRVHLALTLDEGRPHHPFEDAFPPGSVDVAAWRLPPRAYPRERRLLAALGARVNPDLVHTHGYRADVVGSTTAHGSWPLVSTAHGFTGGGLKNRFYEWSQRRAYRRFDAVAAVSRTVAERLLRAGIAADRIRVVPNALAPVDAPLPRAEARQVLGVPLEGFLVGWVGRLSEEKGADVLVDAIPLLSGRSIRYAFLGEGPTSAALEERVWSRGLQNVVHWLGRVADAGRLFAAFDLFVLSSRTEGTPMALLEAMSAGIPIVTTRVGGVPEIVSDQEAILVAPEDPAKLADAIREAYENPAAARERADAARRKLSTAYDPEAWLDAYEAMYRGVCLGKPVR